MRTFGKYCRVNIQDFSEIHRMQKEAVIRQMEQCIQEWIINTSER